MIKYFENAKVCKLDYRQISSHLSPGHVTQFWYKYVKDLDHAGI